MSRAENDLQTKMTTFVTHVKNIEVDKPKINELDGVINEYIKIITDVGDIYVPIQVVVKKVYLIYQIAELFHEFTTEYILPTLKDISQLINHVEQSKESDSLSDSDYLLKTLPSFASAMADFLMKASSRRFNEKIIDLGKRIYENTRQIILISDLSDEEMSKYIYTDNVKDQEALSKITKDILDYIRYLWDRFVYSIIVDVFYS